MSDQAANNFVVICIINTEGKNYIPEGGKTKDA